MTQVYLGLGSNVGDAAANIGEGIALLSKTSGFRVLETSALYETEPVSEPGNKIDQSWFVNAVLSAETDLPILELLEVCLSVERQLGRNRTAEIRWGPRILDIDILFYGDQVLEAISLTVPHPRMHQRAFVLVPLLELAPDFIHPVFGKSVSELHLSLEKPETVLLYGTKV